MLREYERQLFEGLTKKQAEKLADTISAINEKIAGISPNYKAYLIIERRKRAEKVI